MPFCPKCGVEYREGFYKCSDCDTELVASPEQRPPWGSARAVELTRRENPAEARMICRTLEDAGIPCAVKGAEGKEMLGPILGASLFDGTALNYVVIMVPEDRLEEAGSLVNLYFDEENPDEEVEFLECSECGCPVDPEDEFCPACGGKLEEGE